MCSYTDVGPYSPLFFEGQESIRPAVDRCTYLDEQQLEPSFRWTMFFFYSSLTVKENRVSDTGNEKDTASIVWRRMTRRNKEYP
jgi:hypothetical protein